MAKMGVENITKIGEDRTTLLRQSCDRRPDTLRPLSAGLAPRALGDAAVDDHETDGLFGQIVGRLHARRGGEPEVRRREENGFRAAEDGDTQYRRGEG